ncbi:SH2 domain-containing protein B [Citrus sinensis]|uniref:SH2 domain-containing protein B n=1 Tax=Citrus sinensis TaxID=2711 RepID=A0ACB8M1C7_CITSI|nr:SH2 domain-containing protein B [Citrus sinensis]
MGENVIKGEDYYLLKDLRFKIEGDEEGFSLCFWVYLMKSTTFSATLISQDCCGSKCNASLWLVHHASGLWLGCGKFSVFKVDIGGNAPFLALNEKKILMLFPFISLHKEAPDPGKSAPLTELQHASMDTEFPLESWIHVGCRVSTDSVQLHIDGEIVAEKPVSSSFCKGSMSNSRTKITLVGSNMQGYVHDAKILPLNLSIKDHYHKDPPLLLSIDTSSASEIEEDSDGVWSIVGGKASCRRIFSLDVVLLNAFGQPVNKEVEITAALLYADNGSLVEKTSDGEAPLLTSYDGIEFPTYDRPSKLLNGRASFKLKISQLSSKCDNRLFCIRFEVPKLVGFPFLEVLSYPIRCISRTRTIRTFSVPFKRTPAAIHPTNGSQSCGFDDGSLKIHHNTVLEAKPSPSSKRVRLEQEKISAMEQLDGECSPHPLTANKAEGAFAKGLDGTHENTEDAGISPADYESKGVRNVALKNSGKSVSDLTIFKYCLGGLADRSHLLKEIVTSFSDEEILEFAHQDFELLRRIAGCRDFLAQENFEKLWCWLYPVAFTLSSDWINKTWRSTSPKWIEGFITKEEAEYSLQGPRGLQEPGTFVLRFPTSRNWPHPDAGSLIVTYVGSDYTLHHRQFIPNNVMTIARRYVLLLHHLGSKHNILFAKSIIADTFLPIAVMLTLFILTTSMLENAGS